MNRFLSFIGPILILALCSSAQSTGKSGKHGAGDSDQAILAAGDAAAFNLTQAEAYQLEADPKYVPPDPPTKEKVTQPGILMFKNSDGTDGLTLDWTIGQHARNLLESLRASIFRYQVGKPNPAGLIGVNQAAEVWPKLRGIYCREYPGGRYIDLQGQILYCEGKHSDVDSR